MSFPQEQEKQTTKASMENVMNDLIQVSTSASYEELKDAQERLNAQLQARLGEARAEGMAKIVAIVQEFGFTADEMNKALSGKVSAGKGRGKGKGTGTKAAPKYRDPISGSTWTGRGVAPAWIKDVAKEDRARYLIAPEAAPEAAPAPTAAALPEAATSAPEPVAEAVEEAPVAATAPVFGNTVEV